jgi:hypothetical protein
MSPRKTIPKNNNGEADASSTKPTEVRVLEGGAEGDLGPGHSFFRGGGYHPPSRRATAPAVRLIRGRRGRALAMRLRKKFKKIKCEIGKRDAQSSRPKPRFASWRMFPGRRGAAAFVFATWPLLHLPPDHAAPVRSKTGSRKNSKKKWRRVPSGMVSPETSRRKNGSPKKQAGRDRGEDKNKTTLVLARARGGLPPDPI